MKLIRKNFILCCATLSMLVMAGCTKEEQIKVDTKQIESKTRVYAVNTVEDNERVEDKTYSILKNIIKNSNVDVEYPAIEGLEDTDMQSSWNKIIYDKVNEYVSNVDEDEELRITYEVMTENNELLSIVFYGNSYVKGTLSKYRFIYSYNIDLTTGDNIRLKDKVDIDKLAYSIFNGLEYDIKEENVTNEELRAYIEDFFDSSIELSTVLFGFDFDIDEVYAEGYSFYDNGNLCLSFEVNHEMDDYVIIDIKQN